MNDYPNSPYQRVRQLVAEFDRGDISGEVLLARLNLLVEKLESWYAQLGKISTNESYPEGAQLVEHSKESLQMIYDKTSYWPSMSTLNRRKPQSGPGSDGRSFGISGPNTGDHRQQYQGT